MRALSQTEFDNLIKAANVRPRLRRELRFGSSSQKFTAEEWSVCEMVAIHDRAENNGVLLIELKDEIHVKPYEISRGVINRTTGRAPSVICDFCRTWQAGTRAASITFAKGDNASTTFLCCADLQCSLHVRDMTSSAKVSRTQLREDIDADRRVERFRENLRKLVLDASVTE